MLWNSLSHLLYPPVCLHCDHSTFHQRRPLCATCIDLLALIDPELRCPRCFSVVEDEGALCKACREDPPAFKRLAAAFEYMGPAATLLQHLKFHQQPGFAKIAAAYMIVQWERLNWPLPDLIVPAPQSLMHWLTRGYNQSALIAEEIGKLLDRPVSHLLKRAIVSFPQSRLTELQRKNMSTNSVGWKTKKELSDKTIFLIDDVITTGTTLRRCAATLQEGFPKAIYGLAFCIA